MVQSLVVVKPLPAEMSEGKIIRLQHIEVSRNLGSQVKRPLIFLLETGSAFPEDNIQGIVYHSY